MRLLDSISISDYSRLSEALGDGLRVIDARINAQEAAIIHEHVAGLLAVLVGVLSKLRSHGLARIQIGKGGVASFPGFEEYQGIQIPTALRGVTWDDARGAYISSRRGIVLGTGKHGYKGTTLHEVGHALGDLEGYDDSLLLLNEYTKQANSKIGRLDTYYPDNCLTPTGREEFFAESVALAIMDPSKAVELFSPEYIDFLLTIVLAR